MQLLLDSVLYVLVSFAAVHFGAAFVTGWLRRNRFAMSPAVAHAYQAAPEAATQEEPSGVELPQPDISLEEIEAELAQFDALLATKMQATDEALLEMKRSKYAALTSDQLRKECQSHGIQWRDAHGKSKHLKKAEMVEALVNA